MSSILQSGSSANTEGQFASFIGNVSGMHNSGGSEKCLGITPRSGSQLGSYLIEATWISVRKYL
ncbi:transposase [Flavobacterium sp. XS2P14]|uniref:transposase n=1 Tax=Flavobacterium sp. XS2P14 TaxID=3401735 RepID=UPI003AAF95A2